MSQEPQLLVLAELPGRTLPVLQILQALVLGVLGGFGRRFFVFLLLLLYFLGFGGFVFILIPGSRPPRFLAGRRLIRRTVVFSFGPFPLFFALLSRQLPRLSRF